MRSGYLLLIENVILLDCCEAKKKELEKDYDVKVLTSVENSAVRIPHCRLQCLRA